MNIRNTYGTINDYPDKEKKHHFSFFLVRDQKICYVFKE